VAGAVSFKIEAEGLVETLQAFKGLEADLRREANGELRKAAGLAASRLVSELQGAAAASGVPVAPRVASSAKVKSDRLPSVAIGGGRRVGRRGAPASALVWGSEHGGHNFAVGRGSGYWIKPAVDRFGQGEAMQIFKRSLVAIMQRWGLL
jgi:hypothetical protein